MALIAKGVLSSRIAGARKSKEAFRSDVQDILPSIAYQAAMGNPNYANELLDAVRDTVHLRSLTMWLETYAPLVVRKDRFEINKGMAKTMHVTDEASFAEYEREMVKVAWWTMAPLQKAESIFEPATYTSEAFERIAKMLNKHGQPDLAKDVLELQKELFAKASYKAAVKV